MLLVLISANRGLFCLAGRRLVFNGVALADAVGLLTLDAPSGYYLWHLVKQWCLRAWQHAGRAICFTLLKVLVGIPGNSAPGATHLLPEKEKERESHRKKAVARQTRRVTPSCHPAQLTVLHCRFLAVSPCPCPVLCGRLLHTHPRHSNGNSYMALGDRRSESTTAGSALGCARGRQPRLGLTVRCGDLTL